mgnify:CR=1 FL=1
MIFPYLSGISEISETLGLYLYSKNPCRSGRTYNPVSPDYPGLSDGSSVTLSENSIFSGSFGNRQGRAMQPVECHNLHNSYRGKCPTLDREVWLKNITIGPQDGLKSLICLHIWNCICAVAGRIWQVITVNPLIEVCRYQTETGSEERIMYQTYRPG